MSTVTEKAEKSVAEKIRDGDLLTLEEAAPHLGQKNHWGVRNLINSHGLPVVRFGRAMRIDPSDMSEWILKHKEVVTF